MVGLASDIPTTRKAAEYVGHDAIKGCSWCLSHFLKLVTTLITQVLIEKSRH